MARSSSDTGTEAPTWAGDLFFASDVVSQVLAIAAQCPVGKTYRDDDRTEPIEPPRRAPREAQFIEGYFPGRTAQELVTYLRKQELAER